MLTLMQKHVLYCFSRLFFCNVANKIEFEIESQFVDVSVADMCERIQHGGIQDGLHE